MGYKLAGCRVLGGVEIDPHMMALYRENHAPDARFSFLEGVAEFVARASDSLPRELFALDVLDGSPPCSSFSMAGAREDKWGVASRFREGQVLQVLDDLFGCFLRVVDKLRPRVVVAENVKGMLAGNAKGYVREVLAGFAAMDYDVQLFLVDASRAGVPQIRERVFFVARRRDCSFAPLVLSFDESRRGVAEATIGCETTSAKRLTPTTRRLWDQSLPGCVLSAVHVRGMRWSWSRLAPNEPAPTVTSTDARMKLHWSEPRTLSDAEIVRLQTFPDDYVFGEEDAGYVCGMSVPPFLMQRIALALRKQWFE